MSETNRRIRLFPALLIVLAGSLTFKLAAVGSGVQALLDEGAIAQEGQAASAANEQTPPATNGSAVAEPAMQDKQDKPVMDGKLPTSPYPENWTREEVELMLALADRKKELDVREATIRDKEAVLTALDKRIDGKIEELKSIEARMKAMLSDFDDAEQAKFDNLKDMILAMSDKDAAAFLVDLETAEQVEILKDIASKKASKILVAIRKINATEATSLAKALAERKSAPTLDQVKASAN